MSYIADTPVILRAAASGTDFVPATTAQGILLTKDLRYVILDFNVGGTSPSWTVQPLFWNQTAGQYFQGQAITVNSDSRHIMEVMGCEDLYLYYSGVSGTNPTIEAYAIPVKVI